jgi:hypothetical protein
MLPQQSAGFKCNRPLCPIAMAYQGHILVPTEHEQAGTVIDHIVAGMATKFGGYNRYSGNGGYDDGDRIIEREHARLVTNTTDMDREQFEEYLRIEATFVKDVLDESEVLIEIYDVDMELV